jgi:serine O-acetyltransferase
MNADLSAGADPPVRLGLRAALSACLAAVRADHAVIHHYVEKYGSAEGAAGSLIGDLLRKVGLQIMFAYRLMRSCYQARIPLLPMLIARLTRLLYGADIHWKADFEPGVMIVHGMGLCISHGARVATGVILFQNVTLGEGIDPVTREIGAPSIERDVHIGPGATLLGPISVGASSKIMAACVVMCSIPPGSLVEAPTPAVRPRVRPRPAAGDGPPSVSEGEA